MKAHILLAVFALPAVTSAALAQSTKPADIDAREEAVTRSLNNQQVAKVEAVKAANAATQDQYALDRAAFRAEVAARNAKIMNDQGAYARQEKAYADAMAAWRTQNDECNRGILKSCKKPTPVPADFYTP